MPIFYETRSTVCTCNYLIPGMLGLEAWPRPRGRKTWPRPRGLRGLGLGLGLGLVGCGLGLVGFGLEPRGLSRPTTETERNVIGSKSITHSQNLILNFNISLKRDHKQF